jgi:MOSC domain-containing protein YiiM
MTEDEFLKDDYASDEEYQAGVDAALGHYDQEDLDSYADRFNEED